MPIHPREFHVKKLENDLEKHLLDWRVKESKMPEDDQLTSGEFIQVITRVFSNILFDFAKHQIREERHPENPSKPGGLE